MGGAHVYSFWMVELSAGLDIVLVALGFPLPVLAPAASRDFSGMEVPVAEKQVAADTAP